MRYLPAIRHTLTVLILLFAGIITVSGQTTITTSDIPRTISYQGLLSSGNGTPFADGSYSVSITLYADPSGTTPIWSDAYSTNVTNGVFNLLLGEGKPLPGAAEMNRPLWIGTSVNGATEMRPLTPLTASPYAFNVPDKAITGNKIADATITAEKLNLEYIGELQVEGEKISAKGGALNLVGTPSVPLSYDKETQSLRIGKLPTQRTDGEKGTSVLANQDQVWSANGDAWDIAASAGYTPVAGDWLGTSNAVDLEFRVGNTQVMLYQVSTFGGNVPNIIGGDVGNTITSTGVEGSIIAEGQANTINAGYNNAISGGENNTIAPSGATVRAAVIAGGQDNRVDADHANVSGGQNNSVSAMHSNVGGGNNNSITGGNGSNIAGGLDNRISAPEAGIASGHNNQVHSYASSIAGGHDNSINQNAMYSFLGGGQMNTLGMGGASSEYSVIAGGQNNRIGGGGGHAHHSSIGGGWDNEVTEGEAGIASGHNNRVHSYAANIGGGHDNTINAGSTFAHIGGGQNNMVSNINTAIGGGSTNNVNASHGTIGGGSGNTMNADYGTIPGGIGLSTVSSYAQSAMGFNNAPRGAMPTPPVTLSDDPLFMVGNGIAGQSNAFEVSYNGHSTVYGVNGSGTGNAAIEGATYVDNIIYAWGDIDASGAINADFGVSSVTTAGPGVYTVTLNLTDPLGGSINLNEASVTATVIDDHGDYGCTSISVSRIGVPGANAFTVRTYTINRECRETDLPFAFKVTGRQ